MVGELRRTDLVVFVDETGHEEFRDQRHPVFGLGGCAMMLDSYHGHLAPARIAMKDRCFEGSSISLHAASLHSPQPQQLEAISDIFRMPIFARLVTIASINLKHDERFRVYDIVAYTLVNRIIQIAKWYPMDRIVLIFESSTLLNRFANQVFPRVKVLIEENEKQKEIPVELWRMPKSSMEPGLEIADFIMHAAGRRVRNKLLCGDPKPLGKDFQAVFEGIPERLVSYFEVSSLKFNAA